MNEIEKDLLNNPNKLCGMNNLLINYQFSEELDRKSTRLNSSHVKRSRMPSSA